VSAIALACSASATSEQSAASAAIMRWFLADGLPVRPDVQLVKAADAPTNVD
jgi:hypothetical protein